MNIKQTVKKVTALATGAAMLGATVMGAVAYDLSDYPHPFIQNGAFSGKIVVGTRGTAEGIASDYLGIADISTSLQAASKTPVSVSGGSVTVEGGEDFTLATGAVYAGDVFDDTDLDGFMDSDVEVDDVDYDFVEELEMDASSLVVAVSPMRTWSEDDNYGADAYLELVEGGIEYRVTFEDPVPYASVAADELEFRFLGSTVTITAVADDQVTMETSSEHFLEEGDTITIDGHEIELIRVGSTSVIVEVDGQRQIIAEAASKTFDEADDFEVEVESIFYVEGATDNGANLVLGTSLSDTYQNGDAFDLFGDSDDDDESTWIWNIDASATNLNSVGILLNHDWEKVGVTDVDERGALAIGEELEFPNNYASIMFAGWEEPEMDEYSDVNMYFDNDDKDNADDATIYANPGLSDRDYLVFESEEEDSFLITYAAGTDTANEIFVTWDGGDWHLFFDDGTEDYYAGIIDGVDVVSVELILDDDVIDIDFPAAAIAGNYDVTLDFEGVDEMVFDVEVSVTGANHFGTLADEAESGDFTYTGAVGSLNGLDDEERRTEYGVLLTDVESMLDSDEFSMSIPFDGQEAQILVTSRASVIGAQSDNGAYIINPLPIGLVVKDSDAGNMLGSENLLVVGGPYSNSIAAELMGNPTMDQIEQMFEPGRAKIVLFESQNAILVAGYTAQDTVGASRVLARYGTYDLTGSEVEVVVPSLASISVTTPTLPSTVDDIDME